MNLNTIIPIQELTKVVVLVNNIHLSLEERKGSHRARTRGNLIAYTASETGDAASVRPPNQRPFNP
jgi:hypothetical protein